MKKGNPKKPGKPVTKAKTEEKAKGIITEDMFIRELAKNSGRSEEIVRKVLDQLFLKEIPEIIKSGKSRSLLPIGSFHPITTIFTKEEEKNVSLINLAGVWVKFKPGIAGLKIDTDYD